jgi:hypothetical protein
VGGVSAASPGRPESRPWPWASSLLFAALVLLLYGNTLVSRTNFAERDATAYNLPMEMSIHDAWARGTLPVWTPEISGGRPLAPNPNVGAFYPLRVMMAPLPFPLAARLFPLIHWIAAGVGMLVLVSSIGRSAAAAWIAAVTYVLSGVVVGEAFFSHIQPGMALLPWIVWAAGRRSGTPTSRFLTLALLFAVDFLAADIFTIALAIAAAALWMALEEDHAEAWRSAARLGGAVAAGALVAAPQIVATALWIPHTNRAVLGIKLREALGYSIHPWRLVEFVIPYPFGAAWEMSRIEMWSPAIRSGRVMDLFPTLYAGAFAPIAAVRAWKSRERGARFARVLLLAALLCSVLPSLVPESIGGLASPLPLRNPEKLAVAVVFALGLLAAIGFDAWRRSPGRMGPLIGIGVLLTLLAAGTALDPDAAGRIGVALVRSDPSRAGDAARTLPFALMEAGLCWMATVVALDALGRRGRTGFAAALVLLTAVPVLATRKIARSTGEERVFGITPYVRYMEQRDPEGRYRTLSESLFQGLSKLELEQSIATLHGPEVCRRGWYQPTPVFWGRGTVFNQDFDSGDLSRVESLRKLAGYATTYRDSANFFGAVGLKFGIRYRDHEALAGYRPVGGDALQAWDEHERAFPDIRLLEKWREVPDSLRALSTISGLGEGELVLESGRLGAGAARPGTVRVVEDRPERLVVDFDSPDPTWLFVLRAFWPYRTVEIDGRPVEPVPAQLGFTAVPVSPGVHRLVWEERLPGYPLSLAGPVLFGMIAAGLAVSRWRRRTT